MLFKKRTADRGFTLVEVMVVVGIIVLMVGALATAMTSIRENSRDKDRVSKMAEIEFALTAYYETNGSYPDYPTGVTVGQGSGFDLLMSPFIPNSFADPINDDTYHLHYVSDYECNGDDYIVLIAHMEVPNNGNHDNECGTNGSDDFITIIDGPLTEGGSPTYVDEQDEGNWWEDNPNNYEEWFEEQYQSF